MSGLVIRQASPSEAPGLCAPILRSVPEWFGIESATLKYIEETGLLPTWIAFDGGEAVGFVTVKKHFPQAADVHCIAVRKPHHGRGVGTALIRHVEEVLRSEGVRFLQVKTMGPSKPNAEYAMTLRFYRSVGFAPLEEVTGLWPGLPTLILVKSL